MSLHVWLAFVVASCAIALSPGPGAVLSMSHGVSYGVRQTTATIIGLELGIAFILLIAGGGIGALLIASAGAFMVVKVLGAAYLIWLGAKQWRAGIVFMVAVLPQFIDPARPLLLQLLILLATTVTIDVFVMHGYAWAAARFSAWMRSERARRAQNRVFGGVLMGMGASLLLVGRMVTG